VLWESATQLAHQHPDSLPVSLFIQSLNEMIDIHSERVLVGLRNRLPMVLWLLLGAITLFSMAGVGYHEGVTKSRRSLATLLMVFSFSSIGTLIVDLDRPQGPYGQFFIRQLKDMKIKPLVDLFTPKVMMQYAEWCGWTLAHAHARSGKAAEVAGYLGKSDKFDTAIVSFSVAYADQVEQDFEKFIAAIRSGKLEVFRE
jgi:hypothetical protein